ncbi:response regulator [Jonesia denitrificans]|uniref:Response regulator receiver protein n=1 Tax=Jonesia denitrificans (strain ATCC 14870 / DSM 20603 / BCRC 15368 / CIP 55.134 / JCM 11481 / NBRC 15587 / NCTC 10816 / Prevot 55134) TaxID=471856 RepID=C7R0H4_JONDD|nr:response regulator [Jonesia denitrificans]ACV09638.1 response regulator receiver protein [Jonesia denitrificans DSM 20603]ASE09142.1 response regulator [Jonesia denitrificans]QXB43685.1 response regulator [Jonesia denitrificans]SQH22132.1 Chemotaxis protein CheY homolog [Jonesia denitrificans]
MKALVIDDSRTMRRIVSGVLKNLGFETLEAGDGQEALEVMESESDITLCCIDWNMPVMDGLTYVKEVRARAEWRDVTLMMITTESEHGQIVRALAAGAHEYLIKPFTPEAIVQKLDFLGVLPAKEPA